MKENTITVFVDRGRVQGVDIPLPAQGVRVAVRQYDFDQLDLAVFGPAKIDGEGRQYVERVFSRTPEPQPAGA